MRIAIDRSAWSGDGDFTQLLLARLASIEQVGYLRVEDAPASRAGPAFNFICNEIYLGFRIARTLGSRRFLGVLPVPAVVHRKSLTLSRLNDLLAADESIGPPDYSDDQMLQYLRSERAPAAYQARGPKLVEMVRIYEIAHSFPFRL